MTNPTSATPSAAAPFDSGDAPIVGVSALAALLACGLFITIGLFSPGLVLPQIERAFADTPHAAFMTEMIGAIASFAFAVGAPLSGMLVGRFGCRRVIIPGLCLFAIAGTLPFLLDDLRLIVLSRVVLGLAVSTVFTGALAGIGALAEEKRVRLFGLFGMVGGIAAIGLFPLVGFLGHLGWRFAFLVHLSALLVVPLAMAIPASLGLRAGALKAGEGMDSGGLLTMAMAGLLVIAGVSGMSMMISPIYGPLYLAGIGITDTRVAAIPLTLASVAAVIASGCYGPVHNKLGLHGISVTAISLMGVALVIAGMTSNLIVFTGAMVVQSALLALLGPNVNAAAIAFSPPHRAAQAIGLVNGVMFGSQLLFPFIGAWIRGMGGLAAVFSGFGLVMVGIGLVAALRHLVRARNAATG